MARFFELISLAILLVFAGAFAWIGYQMYIYTQTLTERGREHMAKHNITVSRDGAKVGVKELKTEEYSDVQQGWLVKTWMASEWPAYKSRFWNQQAQREIREVKNE